MGSLLAQFPLVQYEDLVGFLDGGKPVGDHDRGRAFQELTDGLLDQGLGRGIDVGGRLVENENRCVDEQRASERAAPRWLRVALVMAGAFGMAIALLGPVRGYTLREVQRRGVDLVVCIDTSRSMWVQDLKPDRMSRARREVRGLLDRYLRFLLFCLFWIISRYLRRLRRLGSGMNSRYLRSLRRLGTWMI